MGVFLIQSSGAGCHDHTIYSNPGVTCADEILDLRYYYHPRWDDPKYHGKDFGKINPGDHIIHYFDRFTPRSPSMIKFVTQVISLQYTPKQAIDSALKNLRFTQQDVNYELSKPRILHLKQIHTLSNPIKHKEIQALVKTGTLSNNMKNAGRQGFNLIEVLHSDLSYVLSR